MSDPVSPIFLDDEDSATDTVSLTSTIASEDAGEYSVEKILCEQLRHDEDEGREILKYLVKWERYPLHRCTWEPKENFIELEPLKNLESRKDQIAAGTIRAFDDDAFEISQRRNEEKTERRRAKRSEKRRALEAVARRAVSRPNRASSHQSLASCTRSSSKPKKRRKIVLTANAPSPPSEDDHSDFEDSTTDEAVEHSVGPSLNEQWTEQPVAPQIKKKGVAQKRVRRLIDSSPSPETTPARKSTSKDNPVFPGSAPASQGSLHSLFNDVEDNVISEPLEASLGHNVPNTSAPAPVANTRSTTLISPPSGSKPQKAAIGLFPAPSRQPIGRAASSVVSSLNKPAPSVDMPDSTGSVPSAATGPKAIRSSAAAAARKPAKMFIDNSAPRRRRERVNEYTFKDSADAKFRNLAEQNRYQKYGRQNEPAPDPESLKFLDLRTGRVASGVVSSSPLMSMPITTTHGTSADTVDVETDQVRRPIPSLRGGDAPRSAPAISEAPAVLGVSSLREAHLVHDRSLGADLNDSAGGSKTTSRLAYTSSSDAIPGTARWIRENVTCRRWLKGERCAWAENCNFAHHKCSETERKKDEVCGYWKRGKCKWSDDLCDYVHSEKRPTSITITDQEDGPPATKGTASAGDSQGLTYSQRNITCRFWFRGGCKLTQRQCKFAHHRCEEITWKKRTVCPRWEENDCNYSDVECESYHQLLDPLTSRPLKAVKFRTCASWAAGGCPKQDCEYYHLHFDQGAGSQYAQSTESDHQLSATFDTDFLDQAAFSSDFDLNMSGAENAPMEVTVTFEIPSRDTRESIVLRMVFDIAPGVLTFLGATGREPVFPVKSICTAIDFRKYCFRDVAKVWASGGFLADDASSQAYAALAEFLKLHVAGAVVQHHKYTLLVFPTGTNDWNFFNHEARSSQPEARPLLRFHLQAPISQSTSCLSEVGPENILVEQIAGVLCDELFKSSLTEERLFAGIAGKTVDRVVFLMFPPQCRADITFLTKYLHSLKATVYLAGHRGSWDKFLSDPKEPSFRRQSGVILYHPTMRNYEGMPRYSNTLFAAQINHFQIGADRCMIDNLDAKTEHVAVRIWPHGSAIYITDDVFAHHPQKALEVWQLWKKVQDRKPVGARNDRLVTRPGLLKFLEALLLEHQHDQKDVVDAYVALYVLAMQYLPDGHEQVPEYPQDNRYIVYSPASKDMPTFYELLDTDKEKALHWAVWYFAGWCILFRERYRRFTVLHQPKDGEDGKTGVEGPRWAKQWQHLRVEAPNTWIARETVKESKKK